MTENLNADVLVIGSGPAGGGAALALATLGVDHMVITKYRWTANTPRSHITNQRTMEVFRDLGIADEVHAQGAPHHLMGETVFCTSLTGDEIGRVRTWGTHPAREADHALASPEQNCDIPQTFREPIAVGRAAARGSRVRFDTEYVGLGQDADGVDVTVRDRVTGHEYVIRAKYVIGADGGRSQVAADVGLPFEGRMDLAGSMNIVFHADLSALVAHRPSVLYRVLQPGADIGGIGLGLARMVRPWNEWLTVWGYDINQPPPQVDDEFAIKIVRELVGDETVPVTIRSISLWGNNKMYATRYRADRVFCMGDACHRHPPSHGLGSNTSIQDAYNLAWKLAYVLRGTAGEGLLDSYDAGRAPIGRQIVLRANKSIDEFGPIFQALGLTDTSDPELMRQHIADRARNTPEAAAQREALRKALELKDYEFNAHGAHPDPGAVGRAVPDELARCNLGGGRQSVSTSLPRSPPAAARSWACAASASGRVPATRVLRVPAARASRRVRSAAGSGATLTLLTQTLRELERDGLVHRTVTAEAPVRVDYALTTLGVSLVPVLRALKDWSEGHIEEILTARDVYDAPG